MIANQSKCESCVVTSTCHIFILNNVTSLSDSSKDIGGLLFHWLVDLHGVMHAACMEVEHVYFYDTSILPCMELTYR
jgi:hypothetical protein